MEVKRGYKQIEVGIIPTDWEVKRLGEMLDYEQPGKYIVENTEYTDNGDTPVLTANKGFILGYTNETEGIYKNLPVIIFDDFTTDSKYVDFPFKVKSSAIKLLKTKDDKSDLRFMFERMQLIKFPLGDHKRYYISEYQHLEILVPDIKEQTAIANALSDADDLISSLEKLIAKKRNIKQGAMQQILTGQTRLPGFSGVWVKKTLGEIAFVNKGAQLYSSETSKQGSFPYLNGGITPSGYTEESNTPGNTIAISEGGNSCGYVQFMFEPYWCGGHCYSVIPRGIDNRFLYHALKANQSSIMGLRVGSGLPNVQKTALIAFSIILPSIENEQTAIATVLSDMDAETEALECKLEKYRLIKQGMMQELLTGKKRLI